MIPLVAGRVLVTPTFMQDQIERPLQAMRIKHLHSDLLVGNQSFQQK
jgi:hypothetical protein